ncbi:MAG: hypothetical protein KatS3mg031_2710 [Chitinophagales bacterium]|nr:MAG: hypothetical protein KatS3mg031_2710 [Chitinophagales bacterium]
MAKDNFFAPSVAAPSVRFYSSIVTARNEWDKILPAGHTLMGSNYLEALETAIGKDVRFFYTINELDNEAVALGVFQLITFSGAHIEKNGTPTEVSLKNLLYKAVRIALISVVNQISLKLLVSGNSFVTGDYGFYLTPEVRTTPMVDTVINNSIREVILRSKQKVDGILIKDYYEKDKALLQKLVSHGYLEFRVNPNMILQIRPHWHTFVDYLEDMVSKYRTRMRKALKRASALQVREMNVAEIQKRLPEIRILYNNVLNEAAFKLGSLPPEVFFAIKSNLKEKFGMIGFFEADRMVAFITYYLHKEDLVAGYMGIDRTVNQQYDLYLNILLRLAETAILRKMKRVIYGRTAMEIKSSVGAEPYPMYLYVKHRSVLINKIIRQVIKFLSREEKWTKRNPFKSDR